MSMVGLIFVCFFLLRMSLVAVPSFLNSTLRGKVVQWNSNAVHITMGSTCMAFLLTFQSFDLMRTVWECIKYRHCFCHFRRICKSCFVKIETPSTMNVEKEYVSKRRSCTLLILMLKSYHLTKIVKNDWIFSYHSYETAKLNDRIHFDAWSDVLWSLEDTLSRLSDFDWTHSWTCAKPSNANHFQLFWHVRELYSNKIFSNLDS